MQLRKEMGEKVDTYATSEDMSYQASQPASGYMLFTLNINHNRLQVVTHGRRKKRGNFFIF